MAGRKKVAGGHVWAAGRLQFSGGSPQTVGCNRGKLHMNRAIGGFLAALSRRAVFNFSSSKSGIFKNSPRPHLGAQRREIFPLGTPEGYPHVTEPTWSWVPTGNFAGHFGQRLNIASKCSFSTHLFKNSRCPHLTHQPREILPMGSPMGYLHHR